jgi:hypothetical protein
VTVSGMTAGGLIKLTLPAASVTDLAGNGNLASTSVDNEVNFVLSGTVQFSQPTYTVTENGTQVTITVTRVGGDEGTLSVDYATTAGSAFDGPDFTGVSGTLTWGDGDSASQDIVININDDALFEGDETFTIALSNVSVVGALGTPSTATITITDYEEGQITFSAPTYTAVEPDNVDGLATIVIQRLNGSNGAVDVTYNMTLGTAEASDIGTPSPNIVSGTLSWADGDFADKVITIPILMDTISEGYETVNFAVSAPTNGAVLGANPNATLIIQPSDPVKISALTGFKPLKFTDTDSDTVVVSLGGKTGMLDVYMTDGAMPISVMNTIATDPVKSTVTVAVVKAKKAVNPNADGKVSIGEVTGSAVRAFTALKSDIVDSGINFNGFVSSIRVGNILNGADIVALGVPTQRTVIVAGTIGDGTTINLGSTLQLLSAASVGASEIIAPRVGSIVVKGAFGADITLSGNTVDHTKFKTMNLLNVGGALTDSDINVTGGIGTILVKGDVLNSNITAFNLNGLTVFGAMTNTDVTLNGTGVNHLKKARTLGAVTVRKAVTDSDINVTGNIGAVTVYGFKNSRLFGGYTGADDGTGTFNLAIPTTLASFRSLANAKQGLTGAFENSSIIASIINAATLATVTVNNGGSDPFGIYADVRYTLVSILDTKQKLLGKNTTSFTDQDFNVKIV